MPFAETRTGARLHYEDVGSGEPIILIHGLLGTARYDLGQVIDWLSADYHVYGLTLRGYGESTPKPRDFPPGFYRRDTEDLLAFMDAIGLEKAHLLGYSDGGEVALMAPGLQPNRFLSSMSIGAVGYFGPAMRPVVQRMFPVNWVTEEEKALHSITNPEPMILQWIQSVKMMIDAGGDVSLSLAKNITCPLLLMLGRQDTLNPEEYGQNFVNNVKKGRLVMFDCGHPIHNQRWEEFQQVVGSFLRETT
jgi:valacyclovir hydrolase